MNTLNEQTDGEYGQEQPLEQGPVSRYSRLTSQQWINLVLALTGVTILLAALAVAYLLNFTGDVSDRLTDRMTPALVAAGQLETTLVNQESGLRGYLISGDRRFLEPYQKGQEEQARISSRMRGLVSGKGIADLDEVERRAAVWNQTFAQPLITTLDRSGSAAVDPALIQRGKDAFDQVRTALAVQGQGLAEARQDARADVDRARIVQNVILLAILATVLLGAIALAICLRLAVLRPLERLAAAARRVTDGDFGHRIVLEGPADLVGLGEDVETMRRRIVSQLETAVAAQQQLEEQAVELRRSNAELEQFAYVASHDLQEPLRKVASFCQMLDKRYSAELDDRGRQYIAFAVDGAKRMQGLINDLLTFSRVGRLDRQREKVDLEQVLDRALANLAAAVEDSGAEIEHDRLPTVTGDPTLLTMLMQNLVGNAVKFRTADRAPHVRLTVERLPDVWELSVQDNGIGIEPQFVDKVFVIFQRLHSRDVYGGTGIGLALCKKIVEYHGGRIWVDTAYRDGTRITFTLPMEPPVRPFPSQIASLPGAEDLTYRGVTAP